MSGSNPFVKGEKPEPVVAITEHTSFGMCRVLSWSAHRVCCHGFNRVPLFFSMAQHALMGHDIIIETSRSHSNTPHSPGRLITPTRRHVPNNTQHSQRQRRNSNPQSLQERSRRPTPYIARSSRSALFLRTSRNMLKIIRPRPLCSETDPFPCICSPIILPSTVYTLR